MLFSSRPRAAWTACGVKLGCDASDWKKLLSWMLGRNGSVGHPAAISLSFRADLEADMTLQPMFFCSDPAEVVAGRIVWTPPQLSESPGRVTTHGIARTSGCGSEICSAGAPDRVIFEFWIVRSAMGAHTASRFANAIRRGRRVSFLSGNWIVDLRNARRADNTYDVRGTSRIARRLKSHRPGLSLMSTVRKQLFVGKGSCQSVDHSFIDPFLKRGGCW